MMLISRILPARFSAGISPMQGGDWGQLTEKPLDISEIGQIEERVINNSGSRSKRRRTGAGFHSLANRALVCTTLESTAELLVTSRPMEDTAHSSTSYMYTQQGITNSLLCKMW